MGQVPKIRVLGEGFIRHQPPDGIRPCLPTTLFCDVGRSGVSSTPTLDLDIFAWMGAHAVVPLALPGFGASLQGGRDGISCRPSIHNLPPPNSTFRRTRTQSILIPALSSTLSGVVQRLNTCFKVLVTESSLSDAAWKHLASLPKLRLLWVSDTPSTEIFESTPRGNAFPALERVKIKVDNLRQHWSFFFSLLESSPLQQVAVTNRGIEHVDVPSQVTLAMLKTKLPLSVNTLKFTGFDPANSTFISNLGPFGSLKALWCNTRCQGLGRCVSPLTDSDIKQLASGLPQLESIWLGHECKYCFHSTTIKSMVSLSTHCLSLKTLRLPCNFTDISEDVKAESGEPDPRLKIRSPCVLRFFAFQWVTMPPPEDIEALRIVASALHHLFPRLWLKDETGAAWKATLDMVKDLRRGELDTAHTM
jgi:hypothetical protein